MSQRPLRALLSPGRERVLAVVFMEPSRWWYRSELARQLAVTPSSLQKPLTALADSGLLRTRRDGNRLYYQANRESPLFSELRSILTKTAGLLDVLKDALLPHAANIAFAFVYGSVARGEETSASDIDVMVVGAAKLSELSQALQRAEQRLGREVNASVHPLPEFRRKLKAGHHFLTAMLDKPKLFIVGTEDDLARATGAGAHRARTHEQE
jgi:predicted nucleotidyltransferase